MSKEKIKEDFEKMTPSRKQKDKMLDHILYKTTSSEVKTEKTIIKMNKQVNYYLSMAACFIGLLLGGKLLAFYFANQTPPMQQHEVLPDSTEQMKQYIFYNGETYVETEVVDPLEFNFINKIGVIEEVVYHPSEGEQPELSATIGLGGTVWEVAQYLKEDKLVLEYSGAYYLYENITNIDSKN